MTLSLLACCSLYLTDDMISITQDVLRQYLLCIDLRSLARDHVLPRCNGIVPTTTPPEFTMASVAYQISNFCLRFRWLSTNTHGTFDSLSIYPDHAFSLGSNKEKKGHKSKHPNPENLGITLTKEARQPQREANRQEDSHSQKKPDIHIHNPTLQHLPNKEKNSQHTMAPSTPLSIATGSINRLVKEEASYHREQKDQEKRIEKLENQTDEDENREYTLRQEVGYLFSSFLLFFFSSFLPFFLSSFLLL